MVSPKSGAVFEKTLVEQYIAEHHKDPITDDPLELTELIEIRPSSYQPPRNGTLNSIPSLLSALQNEWDSVALELFQLRKQLDQTRKELSTALYHHDAAMRVAAKAISERDEARKALSDLSTSISQATTTTDVANEDAQMRDSEPSTTTKIPQEFADLIQQEGTRLFELHKSVKKPKVNVSLSNELSHISTQSLEKKPFKFVVSTAVTESDIFVMSSTGLVQRYDSSSDSYEKVNHPKVAHALALVDSNGQIVYGAKNGHIVAGDRKIQAPMGDVQILLAHPSLHNLVVAIDPKGSFHVIDTERGVDVFALELEKPVLSAAFHIDGVLVAVGCKDGDIVLVDLSQGDVKPLARGSGDVNEVKFSNNGYHLFAVYSGDNSNSSSSQLGVWDLRHQSIQTYDVSFPVKKVLVDKSAQLCIIIGSGRLLVAQYSKKAKSWTFKTDLEAPNAVDGLLVESQDEQLQLVVVTSNSSLEKMVIS